MGNGITAVDLEEETVLIRINEAVISPYKTIISVNQVRACGHQVDDKPLRYGGRQSIFPKFENFHIPLKYIGALTYMSIRKPTRKELNELPVIDLTNPTIWNPKENGQTLNSI